MKVLFIVPYPTEGPSNRFRVEQYLPYLKKEGINYSLRPFFSRRLYKILYKRGFFWKKFLFFIFFTLRRIYDAIDSCRYDITFIHREAFPFGSFVEYLFKFFGKKMLYDFDDALFIPNVSDSNRLIEIFKDTSKIKKIIKISDYVIAGNSFLKDYAINFNKSISILPTSIDTDKYASSTRKIFTLNVLIGWIGSGTTVKYLDMLSDVFIAIFKKYDNVTFLVVGGNWNGFKSSKILCKEWSLESEVGDLQSFDIGIMPLRGDNWSMGKCAFKIIEYMAVGIPVVASRVGMNTEVIHDGINGFLANNDNEWIEKLSLLIEDKSLRRRIGQAGRQAVEERYSLAVNAPRFIEILRNVSGSAK